MDIWTVGKDKPTQLVDFIVGLDKSIGGNLLICFDYFDTLITRTVYPEHTKTIACSMLSKALELPLPGKEIYHIRQDLELAMTTANAEVTGELDFRLDSLALNLYESLTAVYPKLQNQINEERFVALLLNIELAVEKRVQRVCPVMVDVLEGLQQRGLEVLLVSDFYLPASHFSQMVNHQGLTPYFKEIHVSADAGKSKGSGSIFGDICARHNRFPQEVLMIGDNPHADINMAKKSGCAALKVERPAQQKKYEEHKKERENIEGSYFEKWYKSLPTPSVPFKELGISLWLFCHRLFESLQKNQIEDVFFLSKEGEFLKKQFDSYQDCLFGQKIIRSHYLIASRKATFIASLRALEEEDFSRLLDHYRDLSIREFLQSLNFIEDDVSVIVKSLECDCETRINNLAAHPNFQRLIENEKFIITYERYRVGQRENFKSYLQSFTIPFEEKGLSLVDVGWKGSIQDNIYHIFEGKVAVNGYFLGSYNATETSATNRKQGLLFDNNNSLTDHFNVYNNNRSLYEMALGASHGSAERYLCLANDTSKLGQSSQIIDYRKIDGDEIQVVVSDHPEERTLYVTKIKPLQDALFEIFLNLTEHYLRTGGLTPNARWFAKHHARMVYLPTSQEIEFFEELYHLENFGVFGFTDFKTTHNFTLLQRIINLKNIILDPPILESGIWPPVVLRRFGVGFWQKIDGRKRFFREFGVFN
ncbi:HAD-IA family hydrolase [Desulfopila sp. IMCC35008]|uniref:HAD-IA family hydrolase n=1 Tax=Desulfopila sp. IMCC35008 TaxID=2653858 RepID=UPI0013D85920|nr:HAD-IA family hydrolase [Desulfopila sp. IMCC35008]